MEIQDRRRAMWLLWPRRMFYAALTAEEKPGHHHFVKLHIPLSKHELQVSVTINKINALHKHTYSLPVLPSNPFWRAADDLEVQCYITSHL